MFTKIAALIFLLIFLSSPVLAHNQVQIIEMTSGGFTPSEVTVDENATIIFVNKDQQERWPASNVHPTHELYPEFDPKRPLSVGESWSFRPKKAGEHKYHDHLLPHMRGVITVIPEKASSTTPQTSFPNMMWEYGLDFFSKIKNRITALFKFNKTATLPDSAKFISLPYQEQQKILEGVDAQKAWEFIKLTFKGQAGSAGNIHDLAHLSGTLLFQQNGFSALSNCSADFAFGCYHGFLDTAFAKDLSHLSEAYDACKKLDPGNNLTGPVASCLHGIGHGVASFYQTTDLTSALSTCRKISSGQDYCYDGVLMEFARSAPETFFKKEDPLYPCNLLEQKFGYVYSLACGRNQPPLLMNRFKMDFDEVIGVCRQSSSKPFKQACFDALGFSLASSGDVNQIISGCRKIVVPEYIAGCIKSAAGELIFQEIPGWEDKWQEVCAASQQVNNCLENGQRLIKDYGRVAKISFDDFKEGDDPNLYIKNQLKRCFDIGGRDGCYKEAARVLFDNFGLKKTLGFLKDNENEKEVYARCHEVTHYLSRLEYEKQKSISKVYAQCDSTCHGGCYHGTLEAYLKEEQNSQRFNLSSQFPKVCGKLEDYQKPLEYYECLHGMGHAAMFVTEMELKESLSLCDTYSILGERERCYSGVFMENSSSSTSFDHASVYLDKDDPLYPCNILEEKYQALCWQYQSSYFSIINEQDWQKVADLCLKVPETYQDMCFRTVGTNQVGFTQDLAVMKKDCEVMPTEQFQDICVLGVVSSLAYRFVGDMDKMVNFCNLVDQNHKETCFKQIGSGLLDWSADKNLAIKNCQKIKDSQNENWCRSVI